MRKVVIAALIFLAVGCDRGPTGPTGPTVDVRISGRVLDSATGAGIPNTTVAFGAFPPGSLTAVTDTAVTDTTGYYSLVVPYLGIFTAIVDGRQAGGARVTGPTYRGDFLVYPSLCVGRYGTVSDARTRRPIAGALVQFLGQRFVTEIDGWYRLDLGCPTGNNPAPGIINTGTISIVVSHPEYDGVYDIQGRGISGASRVDFEMQPVRRSFRAEVTSAAPRPSQ
jgi:hypothetical protein